MDLHDETFDSIYHHLLINAYTQNPKELRNFGFTLMDPLARLADTPDKPFNAGNSEQFFQWVWSGEDKPFSGALGKAWDSEVGGRNANYGPRILEQIDSVLDELSAIPQSRRASILVLSQEDHTFLKAKREGSKIEYPCTVMIQFHVIEKTLHATAVMRSQNLVSTIRYDVFNFTRFLQEVAALTHLDIGTYSHFMLNSHIMEDEEELAWQFITNFCARGKIKIPPVVHYDKNKLATKDEAIRMPSEAPVG
jgi:thymidylate synthase